MFSLVSNDTSESLVVLLDGQLHAVASTHIHFKQLKDYLVHGGTDPERVRELMDAKTAVANKLSRLSSRVTFDGERIIFDGDALDTALSRHLVRLLREGHEDVRPTVAFMEKLAANPSPLSRKLLWTWLNTRDFALTPEGDIIGYKAVQNTPDNLSITYGNNQVVVNDQVHTGYVPNPIGALVTIARSEVDPDRDHGCAAGLHVGTWDYAKDFARGHGKILTVSVNPRDAVAVPRDHDFSKMRVCAYTVLAVTEVQHDTALVAYGDDDFDGDYWTDDRDIA